MRVWLHTEEAARRMGSPDESVKVVYRTSPIRRAYSFTRVRVLNADALVVAKSLIDTGLRPLVLNLADDLCPGGCVDIGSGAQEESLFRRSNYCMTLHEDLYPIADDEAVYSAGVTVFKDTEGHGHRPLRAPFKVDLIACPGLKYPRLLRDANREPSLSPEDDAMLETKVELIMQTALRNGHDSIVLGALGCGAWKSPPRSVARVMKRVVDRWDGTFVEIAFAVLVTQDDTQGSSGRPSNFEIFREVLSGIEDQSA